MKLSPKVFVNTYLPFAKETEIKSGIDAMFTLAQAALESEWANKAPRNMFFGVKATKDTPLSKRQLLATREVLNHDKGVFPEIISKTKRSDGKWEYRVKDWFRAYDSPEECFSDHADFFFKNKRYAKALEVRYNPYLFAEEIAKAGYATDPNYATILKNVIRTIEKNMP